MTAAKCANATLEGGGVDYCPCLGFVHFVHVDVGPVAESATGSAKTQSPPAIRFAGGTGGARRRAY